jgi:hypothetical protein
MDDNSPYTTLAAALRDRRAVIADRALYDRDSEAHLAELKRVSERIVELQESLHGVAPAQLQHFLERCSYDKALAFIEEMPAAGIPQK